MRKLVRLLIAHNGYLKEIIRVRARKQRAKSYYKQSYKLINVWAKKKTEVSNYYYDLDDRNRSDLASLISVLTSTPIEQVESYFREIELDENLKRNISNSWVNDPQMADAKLGYGRRIGWYAIIRIFKPKVVVETGVHQGVGSCIIAAALIKNLEEGFIGQYFGLDNNKNSGKLFVTPYSKVGKIIYGDAISTLQLFENKIDLFINDSDHSAEYEKGEYETIKLKLSEHAIIIGDNSHSTDELRDFSRVNQRKFIFFKEIPKDHWYPGGGIGLSFQ